MVGGLFPVNVIEALIAHIDLSRYDVPGRVALTKPDIRAASITDTLALVAVEIEGESDAIEKSVAYLRDRGVRVQEMDEDEG